MKNSSNKILQFISSNMHKYEEIKDKFAVHGIEVQFLQKSYGEFQADTFKDIAYSSIGALMSYTNGNFLIEDSGLSIDGLNEFPGPYSSYIYRTIGLQGILSLTSQLKDKKAKFTSVIALNFNGNVYIFEGIQQGLIADSVTGSHGFGFDPIFIPIHPLNEDNKTYAEMEISLKNEISHRGKSMNLVLNFLLQQNN
ncbi:MAG: non-canonical purine NTP pyrophosphatase [Candidatus Heimdallarchaeota archaeon]|nr:non-canonical purine NTP pyrophosphatase [Candidatus Heimdallarchaeota archaeon]